MKTIFNKLVGLFGIYILAALFAACLDVDQFPIRQGRHGKATVAISVTDSAARTVFPQVTLADVASYKLLGGINGAPETELAEFTTAGTSVSLEPGMWNFTLNAYNRSDGHVLQGKAQNQQISLTETNRISFSLSALNSGTGAIRITLNFPVSAGITRITANNGINTEEFPSITSGEFVYTKEEVDAGDYFISFGLYHGDILQTVVSELVLVWGNLTSSKTITLIGEDFNWTVLTGTVTITGPASTVLDDPVSVNQILMADTGNLGGSGAISYHWNRDGTAIPGANNNTYTVQSADQGSVITVTVTRTGISGSVSSDSVNVINVGYHSVTFNSNGGSSVPRQIVAYGATVTRPDPDPTSTSIFVEWYSNSALTAIYNFSTPVTGDITLFAKWTRKIIFTAETKTVNLSNLSGNDIYLVKVNMSNSAVAAGNTGGAQASSPSLLSNGETSYTPDETLPRMGHPAATAFNANPPPIVREIFRPLADFIPPVVGDTRSFWVEQYFNNGGWEQRQATLLATGQYGNIWVMNNGITTAQAQELSRNFDIIYPAETNILGYEYGGGPNGDGGKDGDPKIQILVYDIVNASGVVQAGGFFWGKDFYEQSQIDSWNWNLKTNLAEIFYIDASSTRGSPTYIYSALAHEFQHMINFNRKYVENGRNSDSWYDEMLSMMTEDVMADILGIPTTNSSHPIMARIPMFLATYNEVGFTEWNDLGYSSYAKGYAFGAYLLRNYGGPEILKKILANNTTNVASITAALNEIEPGMAFEQALARFGEAMIYSGSMPADVLTFDKTVTITINGFTYTSHAFNIWNMARSGGGYGPIIFNLTQRQMRPHSVTVHQGSGWSNRSGSFSIILNRPSNTDVEFYLMVK